jgi:hypothetical protein
LGGSGGRGRVPQPAARRVGGAPGHRQRDAGAYRDEMRARAVGGIFARMAVRETGSSVCSVGAPAWLNVVHAVSCLRFWLLKTGAAGCQETACAA